jgi:hypothetical protein
MKPVKDYLHKRIELARSAEALDRLMLVVTGSKRCRWDPINSVQFHANHRIRSGLQRAMYNPHTRLGKARLRGEFAGLQANMSSFLKRRSNASNSRNAAPKKRKAYVDRP